MNWQSLAIVPLAMFGREYLNYQNFLQADHWPILFVLVKYDSLRKYSF
jgi:hypothetical protein